MASRRAEIGRSGSCLKISCGAARRAAPAPSMRSLVTLDGLPETFLSCQVQLREYLAALDCEALHAAKPSFEFGIGRAQCRFRVDIEFARQIRRREQQIADLFEYRSCRLAVRRGRAVRRGVAH